MFLKGSVLLPHTHVPLFIFEPRYRAMLSYALERERMFCLAMMKPEVNNVRGSDDYERVCGIGMVRACVGRADGTSHLILQGLARVELGDLLQEEPFYVAPVRRIKETIKRGEWIEKMRGEILEICRVIAPETQESYEEIEKITTPGYFADTVAHAFLRVPEAQQAVLEEHEVASRLHTLLKALKAQGKA
jgi:Lon protease-like protein